MRKAQKNRRKQSLATQYSLYELYSQFVESVGVVRNRAFNVKSFFAYSFCTINKSQLLLVVSSMYREVQFLCLLVICYQAYFVYWFLPQSPGIVSPIMVALHSHF